MYFRTIVAAFFLDKKKSRSLPELLKLAGMNALRELDEESKAALGITDTDTPAMYGEWKEFADSWGLIEKYEFHDCLQIYSSANHFDNVRFSVQNNDDVSLTNDPALPMALTFGGACAKIKPEIAFLDTRSHYGYEDWENNLGSRAWLKEQYRMISEAALDELDAEPFSLLYIDEHLSKSWSPKFSRNKFDCLPVSDGRLFFSGSGGERW